MHLSSALLRVEPAVLVGFLAVAAATSLCQSAFAQSSEVRGYYQFDPSQSRLAVSGGFAGLELDFFPHGEFGFASGYRLDEQGPIPSIKLYSKFVDVDDAWLVPDSPLLYIWWLDQTLNLSQLMGGRIIQDPNHHILLGEDGQGARIVLHVVEHDNWLHIYGKNYPDCCDFFHYEFDAVAHLIRSESTGDFSSGGDFNRDGVVDAADYTTWRDQLDASTSGADFDGWRTAFGQSTGNSTLAASSQDSPAHHAVPEPTSAILMIIGVLGGFGVAARRHR